MAVLVWDSANGRTEFVLEPGLRVVGRDSSCDIRIDDPTISRRHAILEVADGRATVTDLGSKSHTKINGAGLTRDMPSTLEPGDLLQLGGVILTFEPGPSPSPTPKAPQQRRRAPARRRAPPPAQSRSGGRGPWLWIALGLGAVLLVVVGVLIGVLVSRKDGAEDGDTRVAEAHAAHSRDRPRDPDSGPDPAPDPKKRVQDKAPPKRAAKGERPPRHGVPISKCPDLVEIEEAQYYPLAVTDWTSRTVEGLGGDGRVYAFTRGLVTKVVDRADLRERAQAQRGELPAGDAAARAALAKWCANRLMEAEARALVREALAIDPRQADALLLKDWLERRK